MAKLTAVVNWLPPTEDVTFGAYMREKGLADTALYRIYMLPQLSWMLSCELAMVEGYPATVLADLIRKVNPLTSFFQGIVRIHPSNKALEDAMTVGIKVQLNTKLERLGEDRCINGEHFDAVVVATEAPAVHKILPVEWTSFFDEFQYHRSSVVLHRDPALMPKSREDWRVLNVRSTEQEPAAELSVWMNAYYEADFNKDVFQTWNAHRPPAKELVIQESHFARVVHTASSGRLQREVAAVQGRKGFYFAGAFAVHGMGLLEQAIASAHAAAEAVRRDAGGGERAAAGGA